MDNAARLVVLKSNIDRPNYPDTTYLTSLLTQAEAFVKGKGIDTSATAITADSRIDYCIIDYAAWLFRNRDGANENLSKMLKVEINEILLSQKAADDSEDDDEEEDEE